MQRSPRTRVVTAAAWALASSLLLPSCGGGGTPAAPSGPPAPPPGGSSGVVADGVPIGDHPPADLTIRFVERLPKIDYVVNAADPAVQGWPEPGAPVTWRAHLRNWSDRALEGVDYAWMLDGARVAEGTVRIAPRSEATVDYPWTWDRARHRLELVVDGSHRFTVRNGPRNRLTVFTDALSIGLYVEQSVYDHFRRFQPQLRIGHSSFEDWAHLQVQFWNGMFEAAVFPETPQGVLDRVRLDAVHLVADGALPLDPAAHSIGGTFTADEARPNVADRTVDMQWGFPARLLGLSVYSEHTSTSTQNQFYFSGYLQHEMGHARYLIDVYGWDVYDGTAGSRVDVMEDGERVAGSRYLPGSTVNFNGRIGLRLHEARNQGLMTNQWRFIDRYSAVALNLIAGHRPVDGNYNEPGNLGVYMSDLPRQNRLTLRDAQGSALAGAEVRIFRASPGDPTEASYAKVFDATPDAELRADGEGNVLLGTNPFTGGAPVVFMDSLANGTVLLRVAFEGRVGYGFLESSQFNLEYWRGNRDLGTHELTVTLF